MEETVKVWDAANGKLLYTLVGRKNLIYCVAWSPDGKRLAGGGADKTVKVWQLVE